MDLFEQVKQQLSVDNIKQTVQQLNGWHRYTGTPDGEAAAELIAAQLEQYGVSVTRNRHDAYLSRPLSTELQVDGTQYRAIAAVFSGEADHLEGPLWWDATWQNPDFDAMAGQIVVTQRGGSVFARKAKASGALAVIHVQTGKEDLIHHMTVGAVWGSPNPDDRRHFPYIPYAAVNRADGTALLEHCHAKKSAILTVKMDNAIRENTIPVATIRGKSENYVLVSAHYDSWYEGITDNACADAILLEYARVLQQLRHELDRSVVIAWWSGHSDGRYSGSTWFCDNYWNDLAKHCVAHINIDLAGCKGANQITARTTRMEGEAFTASLIHKYTGREAKPYIPMLRGADQSFWGVRVPIAIMLKYEPWDEDRDFDCPSGGVWWHTDQDTIDKMDADILQRDALINAEMLCQILKSRHLPVDLPGFLQEMKRMLWAIEEQSPPECGLQVVYDRIDALGEYCEKLLESEGFAQNDTDGILKAVGGELVRLVYSTGSPYYHDSALTALPFQRLRKTTGITPENTPPDKYLFIQTEFVRQRNRLVGQLDALAKMVDTQLRLWEQPTTGRERVRMTEGMEMK